MLDLPDSVDLNSNKLENKAFEIQKMISEFEYRLHGYMWMSNGEKMGYEGNALCGEKVIQEIILLLHPFSKEILMISSKSKESWAKQQYLTCTQMNRILFNSHGEIPSKNYMAVALSFFNLMKNIGDIINASNSKNMLRDFFGMDKNENSLTKTSDPL